MKNKISRVEQLKRLNKLLEKVEQKEQLPIFVNLDEWLDSPSTRGSFIEHLIAMDEKHPTGHLIIDTLSIQTDMYLEEQVIWGQEKEVIKRFRELALRGKEIHYMQEYVIAFEDLFDIDEAKENLIHDLQNYKGSGITNENGRELTYEEKLAKHSQRSVDDFIRGFSIWRNIFSEMEHPFLLDFFDYYNSLNDYALVERYKDKRFFQKTGDERVNTLGITFKNRRWN